MKEDMIIIVSARTPTTPTPTSSTTTVVGFVEGISRRRSFGVAIISTKATTTTWCWIITAFSTSEENLKCFQFPLSCGEVLVEPS